MSVKSSLEFSIEGDSITFPGIFFFVYLLFLELFSILTQLHLCNYSLSLSPVSLLLQPSRENYLLTFP